MLATHQKNKRVLFDRPSRHTLQLPRPFVKPNQDDGIMKLAPSIRAVEEDEKHRQPIDVMSDYESRLIKKEALRNPLSEPEPDEDTPTGLRRRQLCFNLGNPYKKNASKVRHTLAACIWFLVNSNELCYSNLSVMCTKARLLTKLLLLEGNHLSASELASARLS